MKSKSFVPIRVIRPRPFCRQNKSCAAVVSLTKHILLYLYKITYPGCRLDQIAIEILYKSGTPSKTILLSKHTYEFHIIYNNIIGTLYAHFRVYLPRHR